MGGQYYLEHLEASTGSFDLTNRFLRSNRGELSDLTITGSSQVEQAQISSNLYREVLFKLP